MFYSRAILPRRGGSARGARHSGSAIPTRAVDRLSNTPKPATVVQADELLGRMKRAQASTAGYPLDRRILPGYCHANTSRRLSQSRLRVDNDKTWN